MTSHSFLNQLSSLPMSGHYTLYDHLLSLVVYSTSQGLLTGLPVSVASSRSFVD